MSKDKEFKFSYPERRSRPKNKNVKVGQKRRGLGQVIYFCNFCTPLNLWSGWKCKLQILCLDWSQEVLSKNAKLGQLGAWSRSRDLRSYFEITSISLKWVKLETSQLVCKLTDRLKDKTCKSMLRRGLGEVTYFLMAKRTNW